MVGRLRPVAVGCLDPGQSGGSVPTPCAWVGKAPPRPAGLCAPCPPASACGYGLLLYLRAKASRPRRSSAVWPKKEPPPRERGGGVTRWIGEDQRSGSVDWSVSSLIGPGADGRVIRSWSQVSPSTTMCAAAPSSIASIRLWLT